MPWLLFAVTVLRVGIMRIRRVAHGFEADFDLGRHRGIPVQKNVAPLVKRRREKRIERNTLGVTARGCSPPPDAPMPVKRLDRQSLPP